ncbi:MAG: YitT family protein [Ekhidna sp.]|uniref:YitT family protein n=1 Tax=Ekhidna sp. TaxID=2608089 RepID=UPI0032EB0614
MKSTPVYRLLKSIQNLIGGRARRISDYTIARYSIAVKDNASRWFKELIFLSLGILSAGFGLHGFLLPNDFIDGGVTGISLLTRVLTDYPLPILIVVINIPFIVLGYFQIGKSFVIKSIIAILGLALALNYIHYPIITSDKLLVSVFGGFFLGAGIGLSVRGGGVLDGTEVLAIYLGRKTGLTIGDLILVFNIIIFSSAAYLLSMEIALYSILTYLSASKTVDFVIEGVEEYIGVIIISKRSEPLRLMITEKMGRGVTIYQGKSGFGKREDLAETEILYSVITRLEIGRMQNEVKSIDPQAFIVMNSVKDLKGGMIKKRQFKEH